jgi:hypothetical protein
MNGNLFPSGMPSKHLRSLHSASDSIRTVQNSAPRVEARRREGTDHVKFVQCDNDLLDTKAPDEHEVLPSLAATTESGLEFSIGGINDEQCTVCLSCPGDHIGHKVFMAWCVENGECLRWQGKAGLSNVDGNASAEGGKNQL